MKAIVLSAGQGRRLLPLTEDCPKCLLPVNGERTMLSVQLDALARCGIDRATVVAGFGADQVECFLTSHAVPGLAVETLFNPFHSTTDNLVTCWLARQAMRDDFLLLNGDTLFGDDLLRRVLAAPPAPITVAVDHKAVYDDDDMKVSLDARGRLLAIGKDLPAATVGAESIGMIAFRESGSKIFVDALERAIHEPVALRRWYLSVVNDLAQQTAVETASVHGLWWCEIDSPADLAAARADYAARG